MTSGSSSPVHWAPSWRPGFSLCCSACSSSAPAGSPSTPPWAWSRPSSRPVHSGGHSSPTRHSRSACSASGFVDRLFGALSRDVVCLEILELEATERFAGPPSQLPAGRRVSLERAHSCVHDPQLGRGLRIEPRRKGGVDADRGPVAEHRNGVIVIMLLGDGAQCSLV